MNVSEPKGVVAKPTTQTVVGAIAVVGIGALAALLSGPLAGVIVAGGSLWLALQSLPATLGIYVVLAALPIGVVFHGHHFELSDVVALMAMVGLLKKWHQAHQPLWASIWPRPFARPLQLLLLLSILSLTVSISHATTVVKILEYVEFFLVIVAVAHETGWDEESWRLVLLALFISGAIVSIYGFIQFLWGIGPVANAIDGSHVRADAWFGQPNAMGAFTGDMFPLILGLIWLGPNWAKHWWGMWFFVVIDATGVIETYSRGAWVADAGAVFFMGLTVWILRGFKHLGKRYFIAGIAIPVLMFIVLYILGKFNLSHLMAGSQTGGHRLRSTVTAILHPNAHNNMHQRLLIWGAAFQAIKHHPFLGVGLGGFHHYIATHRPNGLGAVPPMAHNLYFEWGADLGIGGIVSAIWLEWTWIRTALSVVRDKTMEWPPFWYALAVGALGTTISFTMHNWIDFTIDHGVVVPLLMALALLWVMVDKVRAAQREH